MNTILRSRSFLYRLVLVISLCSAFPISVYAQTPTSVCPRGAPGSVVFNPTVYSSKNHVLQASLSYETRVDYAGRQLFCFMTSDGYQNPTLHVSPGDKLILHVTNHVPDTGGMSMKISGQPCGASIMNSSSVNVHYHGMNLSPVCNQDEVIQTTINTGQTFTYSISIPNDEPPGLYWYHPHIHGMAEPALLGGATGVIVVDGIANFQPSVSNLHHRILVIRDQNLANNPTPADDVPSWDLTLNTIPISYPTLTPAIISMTKGKKEFWRVANTAADSLVDLQVLFDGVAQPIQIIGLDGVPTGSQDGASLQNIPFTDTHLFLATGNRGEFIVSAPPASVKKAVLVTKEVKTGPFGDTDTARVLANIQTQTAPLSPGDQGQDIGQTPTKLPLTQRFDALATASVNTTRKLYFSEVLQDPSNPDTSPTDFFITVDGAKPKVFDAANGPAITTTQGSVEEWTVENRSLENHEFHIHQIHFLVESQKNYQINGSTPLNVNGQFLDTIQVPFWDGNPNHPYPSVTLRMDFRGPDIGDFVYHCHILGHEDNGMMAIIRVKPSPSNTSVKN